MLAVVLVVLGSSAGQAAEQEDGLTPPPSTQPGALVRPRQQQQPPATPMSSETQPAQQAEQAQEGEAAEAAEKPELDLHVGGALRFNFFYKTWEGESANRQRLGDFGFDTFRLNVDATYGPLEVSAEYRFYAGYHMLHHGYLGAQLTSWLTIQAGVTRVPFGILPYASHNWFFDVPYYLGLEDDYDLGLKALLSWGALDLQLAFYKNDEGSYSGGSLDSARYSYDVVRTSEQELGYAGLIGDRSNVETNQANLRLAYSLSHAGGALETGISGQMGQLFNEALEQSSLHWAVAAHLQDELYGFNPQLELAYYRYSPEVGQGQDDSFVVMGAYDAPYLVASEGWLLVANLSYTFEVGWGVVSSLSVYNDYSLLYKPKKTYPTTQQNVTGVLLTAGPIFSYLDFAAGKHHPWLGPAYGSALASGDPSDEWHLRLNLNLGIYY